jgi:hypothetical protein
MHVPAGSISLMTKDKELRSVPSELGLTEPEGILPTAYSI